MKQEKLPPAFYGLGSRYREPTISEKEAKRRIKLEPSLFFHSVEGGGRYLAKHKPIRDFRGAITGEHLVVIVKITSLSSRIRVALQPMVDAWHWFVRTAKATPAFLWNFRIQVLVIGLLFFNQWIAALCVFAVHHWTQEQLDTIHNNVVKLVDLIKPTGPMQASKDYFK